MQSIIKQEFREHIAVTQNTIEAITYKIEIASKICINSLKNGGKIPVNTTTTNPRNSTADLV